MLVSHNNQSEYQYGDYIHDVADADLLNFDGAATIRTSNNNGVIRGAVFLCANGLIRPSRRAKFQ